MGVMDWSLDREDWTKQRPRSKLPRRPCGTGASSLCPTRSGAWRLRQQNAEVYEVSHWFDKRFRVECRAPKAWKILRLVFLKNPDAKLEKGVRVFHPIVLLKWYTTVLVDQLHEEKSRLMEELARGSRERSQLLTHAGLGNEYRSEEVSTHANNKKFLCVRLSLMLCLSVFYVSPVCSV